MSENLSLKSYQDVYAKGRELNVAPFDEVISFVFRHLPDKPREWTRILEVGCGACNNLLLLAQERFQVFGVDLSADALAFGRDRFDRAGLQGNFFQRSFTDLPWKDKTLDLAFDRAALSYATPEDCQRAIDEVHRVLAPGGKFMFTPYTMDVNGNTAYTFSEALQFFGKGWNVFDAERVRVLKQKNSFEPDAGAWTEKDSHYRIYAERV